MSEKDRIDLPELDRDALTREAPELLAAHDALTALAAEATPDPDWARLEAAIDASGARGGGLHRRALVLLAAAVLAFGGSAIAYATSSPVRGAVSDVVHWVTGDDHPLVSPSTPAPSSTPSEVETERHGGTTIGGSTVEHREGGDDSTTSGSHEGSTTTTSGDDHSGTSGGDDHVSTPAPTPESSSSDGGSSGSGGSDGGSGGGTSSPSGDSSPSVDGH